MGDIGSNLNLPAGKSVEIDGTQALALMRARYNLGDGSDIERIKRQQQFIGAMIRKATSTGLLVDPIRLYDFLNATTKSITTDGFGIGTMRKLASALHKAGAGSVQILTVPLAEPAPPRRTDCRRGMGPGEVRRAVDGDPRRHSDPRHQAGRNRLPVRVADTRRSRRLRSPCRRATST